MTDPNSVGADTLGADVNKLKTGDQSDTKQGVVSAKLPELTLEMSSEDVGKLTSKWLKIWDESPTKAEWLKLCEDNENYWVGKQFDTPKGSKERPNVDNLIFESLETYLPQITRRNPDPIVSLDEGQEGTDVTNQYLVKVKTKLGNIADKSKLRLKLKRVARNWGIYLIGVVKYGWDLDKDMPAVRVIRPKKLVLDPDAWIDEDGYTGNRIGEYRKMEAGKLLKLMGEPTEAKEGEMLDEATTKENTSLTDAIKAVKEKVKDDLATDIQFIEWWTREYMCWTLDNHVLLKRKNPHWNYDRTIEPVLGPDGQPDITAPTTAVDEMGGVSAEAQEIPGINHFTVPQMPYSFLVVFNLGDQPMDKTSLITQNLANQDRINKRNKQIDKNADNMNEGLVVSLERAGLSDSQAKNVSAALRKGGVVAIPSGNPQEAIWRPDTPGLPADVFNDRNDMRDRMRDIFGTRGSSAGGLNTEQTVRGKILARGTDTDRIGGGVSEYLEQLADDIYNWMVQLLYVYDPEFQFGEGEVPPRILVSVKEGSLLPKDSTTIANQAIELASAGKMSNLDLYKRLEYPNPEEMAANAWLEVNAPEILYAGDQRVAQALAARQGGEEKPPSLSANYKDLSPNAKSQLLAKAGIQDDPAAILGDETAKEEIAATRKEIAKPKEKSMLSEASPSQAGADQ